MIDSEHPLVMGHEASAIVDSVGSEVTGLKPGDHVAVEPGFPCRRCRPCKGGFYNRCLQIKFAAAPPDSHGALTKYFLVPEDFAYKISSKISLQEAVLLEPLAVAIHTARIADIKPGQDVIVMGSGTVGLLCGAVAKVFGADRVILVDISRDKVRFAKDYLDCETYLSDVKSSAEENAAILLGDYGNSEGVDVFIEATGVESCIRAGIYALRMGGTFVQTGLGKPDINVPMLALSEKELAVKGCFRYGPGDFELAIKLLEGGQVSVKELLSNIVPFEKATTAWDLTAGGQGIKNIIQVVDSTEVGAK